MASNRRMRISPQRSAISNQNSGESGPSDS
jgi:hypothetical protein